MSHKRATEILKHYGLEKETIADIVYEEIGNVSESAFYVGENYILKYTANLRDSSQVLTTYHCSVTGEFLMSVPCLFAENCK